MSIGKRVVLAGVLWYVGTYACNSVSISEHWYVSFLWLLCWVSGAVVLVLPQRIARKVFGKATTPEETAAHRSSDRSNDMK